MVGMIVWISMTISDSGIIEHIIHLSETLKPETDIDGYTVDKSQALNNYVELNTATPVSVSPATIAPDNLNEQVNFSFPMNNILIFFFNSLYI